MKVNAAFAGEPIPSDESILKKVAPISTCLILFPIFVTLYYSTCSETFVPEYVLCMRSNFDPTSWQKSKLLIIVPFTFIIGTNILFDLDANSIVNQSRFADIIIRQNSPPITYESPMNTSCISILFFVMFMIQSMFLKSIDRAFYIVFLFGCILVVLLIKGPLVALWTNRQLKQKNQQQKDIQLDELTLSAQAQHSQLESHAIAEML